MIKNKFSLRSTLNRFSFDDNEQKKYFAWKHYLETTIAYDNLDWRKIIDTKAVPFLSDNFLSD